MNEHKPIPLYQMDKDRKCEKIDNALMVPIIDKQDEHRFQMKLWDVQHAELWFNKEDKEEIIRQWDKINE